MTIYVLSFAILTLWLYVLHLNRQIAMLRTSAWGQPNATQRAAESLGAAPHWITSASADGALVKRIERLEDDLHGADLHARCASDHRRIGGLIDDHLRRREELFEGAYDGYHHWESNRQSKAALAAHENAGRQWPENVPDLTPAQRELMWFNALHPEHQLRARSLADDPPTPAALGLVGSDSPT